MIDTDTIIRARNADLLTTAAALGASLKRVTASEHVGPCPVCGGVDRFSINVRKRLWRCRGCATGGDVIHLTAHVRGLDFKETVAFLVDGDDGVKRKPARLKPANDEASNAFVSWLVAAIVRELVQVWGTPGEKYLAEARKIDTEAIADVLQRTDAIGWHPSLLFREEDHPLDGKRLGAIVGVMTGPVTAKPTGAISRTYLDADLRKIGKAKTLGSPAGIARLSADEDVLLGLFLAEGLETALDAMTRGFRPMWSTGSASLMASFPILAGLECLTAFADNDRNDAGLIAANEVAGRWRAAARTARVFQRVTTGDLNDAFRELEQ